MAPAALSIALVPVALLAVSGGVAACGWTRLARAYPRDGRQPSFSRHFRGLSIERGWLPPMHYNGCATVGASEDGLFLSVMWPFRLFHSPLFVPWAAIQTTAGKSWLGGHVDLTFADVPGVTVRMPKGTAEGLADAVGDESFGISPRG